MSYEDYWDGDCDIVKYYRDKAQYELEEKNRLLWLQGMYLYDALLRLSPALKPFVKNPKPEPYMEDPYPVGVKTDEEKAKAKNEKKLENGLAFFTVLATDINQTMTQEGGDDPSGT